MERSWVAVEPINFSTNYVSSLVFDAAGRLFDGVELFPGGFGTPIYVRFDDPEEHAAFLDLLREDGVPFEQTTQTRGVGPSMRRVPDSERCL